MSPSAGASGLNDSGASPSDPRAGGAAVSGTGRAVHAVTARSSARMRADAGASSAFATPLSLAGSEATPAAPPAAAAATSASTVSDAAPHRAVRQTSRCGSSGNAAWRTASMLHDPPTPAGVQPAAPLPPSGESGAGGTAVNAGEMAVSTSGERVESETACSAQAAESPGAGAGAVPAMNSRAERHAKVDLGGCGVGQLPASGQRTHPVGGTARGSAVPPGTVVPGPAPVTVLLASNHAPTSAPDAGAVSAFHAAPAAATASLPARAAAAHCGRPHTRRHGPASSTTVRSVNESDPLAAASSVARISDSSVPGGQAAWNRCCVHHADTSAHRSSPTDRSSAWSIPPSPSLPARPAGGKMQSAATPPSS